MNTTPITQPVQPFIGEMLESRRARYALDQTCTPAFLHWIDTQTPREGVGANEAWNAGYACAVEACHNITPNKEESS